MAHSNSHGGSDSPSPHVGNLGKAGLVDLSDVLAQEGAWLLRLARQLVRDGQRADEAVQTTLVAAWKRKSADSAPTRSWLARVLRNSVRQSQRADSRRALHEALVPPREPEESADSTLERLELQRRVLDTVEQLDEPYRTTIVLRFLDDLSPRAISARTGTPLKTVHTRIERGLARLRTRLEQVWKTNHAQGPGWHQALLALPGLTPGVPQVITGAIAMGTVTKLVGAAALVTAIAGVTYVLAPQDEDSAGTVNEVAAGPRTPEHGAGTADLQGNSAPSDVDLTAFGGRSSASGSTPDAEPTPESVVVRGVVVDLDENPVAGVRVVSGGGDSVGVNSLEVMSDIAGEFHLQVPATEVDIDRRLAEGLGRSREKTPNSEQESAHGNAQDSANGAHDGAHEHVHRQAQDRRLVQISAEDPDWICLSSDYANAEFFRLIVAPKTTIRGSVFNEDGMPLESAFLRLSYPSSIIFRLQGAGRSVINLGSTATSDAEGRFEFPGVPAIAGSTVSALKSGYAEGHVELEPAHQTALGDEVVITLARPVRGDRTLEGRVLTAAGRPFEGAWVSAGEESTQSDAEGWFLVPLPRMGHMFEHRTIELRALAAGVLPGHLSLDPEEPLPSFVELQLGGPSLSITGRVLDANGSPITNGQVWVSDTTRFGMIPTELQGTYVSIPRTAEDLVNPENTGMGSTHVLVESDGSFELKGLLDREYTLHALDNSTLASVLVGTVSAGTHDLHITVNASTPAVPVAGYLVDRRGTPIEGAMIIAYEETIGTGHMLSAHQPSRRTDAEGHFRFAKLVPEGLSLMVSGFNVARDATFYIQPGDDLGGLELVVGGNARLRVHSTDPAFANAVIQVLDSMDQSLSLQQDINGVGFISHRFELTEGTTGIMDVEDSAATLLVRREGRETLRIPLILVTGEVTDVSIP